MSCIVVGVIISNKGYLKKYIVAIIKVSIFWPQADYCLCVAQIGIERYYLEMIVFFQKKVDHLNY
jgi:hypothetical protein